MADNRTLGFDIVVNTQGSEKTVTTLKQDIDALQRAIEQASKTGLTINIDGYAKNINEARELQNSLISQLEQLNSKRIDIANKAANAEAQAAQKAAEAKIAAEQKYERYLEEAKIKQATDANKQMVKDSSGTGKDARLSAEVFQKESQYLAYLEKERLKILEINEAEILLEKQRTKAYDDRISNAKATQNANANKQWWDDQETARKARTEQLKTQMGANAPDYASYSRQLRDVQSRAEQLHQEYVRGGKVMGDYGKRMKVLQEEARVLKTEMKAIPDLMSGTAESTSYLGSFGQKLRSHANWIIAGATIAATVAIPAEIIDSLRETEALTLKIKQNLELAPQYHGNESGLNTDVKHLQDVAATFAMGYGTSLKESLEMMQVLSRRFKSPEELTYYTNLAMIMHKLDFVEPKKAAEDLEATILSMGLNFEESRKFIDQFSVAVHVARITGTELLTGLQRSAATFKNMNFNTAEAIAMISTLSTVTAKAGANVGASINSVLINIDFKKAAQALKAYSIEVYDSSGRMHDGLEIWREISATFNGLDDQKANEFANAISGGEPKLAA